MTGRPYDPQDWYWVVAGSTTQVWSSASRAYMPTTDATYQSWLASGGIATAIGTETDLWDVVCPLTCTNYQARATMLNTPSKTNAGSTLFADVDAAMKSQGGASLQAWEYANVIERKGQLVQSLAANFGLSDADVRNLFWAAEGVS